MCAHLCVLLTAPQDHWVGVAACGLKARGRGLPCMESWGAGASRNTNRAGERDLWRGCDCARGERRHVEATHGACVLTRTCRDTSNGEQQPETSVGDCGKNTGVNWHVETAWLLR
mmetsp:Transcript_108270/g.215042  ORF Transcript_108270/g.215042 Transcript_108270/m.215042 type:complete len:115 (+) Transcript_108270:372-716(+)